MAEMWALAVKDWRVLVRDKGALFFTFILPLIFATFFGSIFASSNSESRPGMKVVVVDEDQTAASEKFATRLGESSALQVSEDVRASAEEKVRRGEAVAMIVLTAGFEAAGRNMFMGEAPVVEVGVDPSRVAEAGMLEGVLMAVGAEMMQERFADPDLMKSTVAAAREDVNADEEMPAMTRAVLNTFFGALDTFVTQLPAIEETGEAGAEGNGDVGFSGLRPLVVRKASVLREQGGPKNSFEISIPQASVWGVMGAAAGFGLSLVVERTRGTLVRLRVAPIGRMQILGGKAIACFVTTLAVLVGLMLYGILCFGVRPDSILLLGIAIICVGVCFVGIMMLLSVMGRTEQSAGGIGWAVLLVMAMLGGGMVPLAIMPGWMQTLGVVSPVRWAVLAMEGAIWRGFSGGEMILPCVVLVGVGVATFGVGVRAFRWVEG